jgi:hypothetical protein
MWAVHHALPAYLSRLLKWCDPKRFASAVSGPRSQVALLTPAALLRLGLRPAAKVLDLAMRVRMATVER